MTGESIYGYGNVKTPSGHFAKLSSPVLETGENLFMAVSTFRHLAAIC
jgi:hypothetical protein